MENKSHALAAGAFVLAITALLVALAVWLTRDAGTSHPYELSSRDAVTGLQPQAAVRYKGVAVGKVTHIGFDPDVVGNVLIRIAVDDTTPLSPTAFATLSYQGITGLAFVQIDDAGLPQERLPSGRSGVPRLPLETSQLGKLTQQVPHILEQVDQATLRLNQLLSDENQKLLTGVLTNADHATTSLAQLSARLEQTVTQRLDPALARIPAMAADTSQAMRALQSAADTANGSFAAIGQTAVRLNEKGGVMDRLADGTGALSHAANAFGSATLPRINRVAEDASRAARQLGRTVNGISDQPQSLIFGGGAALPGPGEAGFVAPTVNP
ncbi:MAG: MCE family protein [Ferruginibacter sp.]|nr:MCE family protein [Rhodoferax sp.]